MYGSGADGPRRNFEFARDLSAEEIAKAGDVIAPFAERGDFYRYDREAIVQVLTE